MTEDETLDYIERLIKTLIVKMNTYEELMGLRNYMMGHIDMAVRAGLLSPLGPYPIDTNSGQAVANRYVIGMISRRIENLGLRPDKH
jgi:hypothetical protein